MAAVQMMAAAALCLVVLPTLASAGDPVMEWNSTAQTLTVVPALAPVEQTRAMAIVHVAVHDAVNGITREYEQYDRADAPPAGASPEAAAIAAAYHALSGLFDAPELLAAKYSASLAAHGISPDDPGLGFGRLIANRVVERRRNDGASLARYVFVPVDAGVPGVWQPLTTAPGAQSLLPGWGKVTPWVLRGASQFELDAPPALDSERYATDYNEVLQLGAAASTVRTPEQTQIAAFWRASPTAIWNPILRNTIERRSMTLSAVARAAALFYLAAADASAACWEAKYVFNFWRPQAAITRGGEDGNAATAADPAWRPLVPTPPHPEYPSGHTVNSGAMAFVLKSLFGDAPGHVIEAALPSNPFVRHWETYSEGVREVIDARIYSGIHFRSADEAGARLGRQVAQFVVTHALRPVKGS